MRVTVQRRNLIAVVDDDHGVLKSIGRLLEASGFEAELFTSAEAYNAHPEARDAACLILDIHMPGMSGIDLQRELSRSGCAVPVIIVTASDSTATLSSAIAAGCVAYIRKPFTATALLEAITKAVGGKT
jgi:FixJ family two-component response regulator